MDDTISRADAIDEIARWKKHTFRQVILIELVTKCTPTGLKCGAIFISCHQHSQRG